MLTQQSEVRTPKEVKKLFKEVTDWYINHGENLSHDVKESFKKIYFLWSTNESIRNIYRETIFDMGVIGQEVKATEWTRYVTALTQYYDLTSENTMPKGITG